VKPSSDAASKLGDVAVGDQRQDELGPRKCRGSQQRTDVAAQSAGGDEDQSVAAFGELVGELQCDATPEGMPDDGRRTVAESVEEISQNAGVCAERVVARRRLRPPVARKVRGHDAAVAGQFGECRIPGVVRGCQPVDEEDDGATARLAERDPSTVHHDLLGGGADFIRARARQRRGHTPSVTLTVKTVDIR